MTTSRLNAIPSDLSDKNHSYEVNQADLSDKNHSSEVNQADRVSLKEVDGPEGTVSSSRASDGKLYVPLDKSPQGHSEPPGEHEHHQDGINKPINFIGRYRQIWAHWVMKLPVFVICYGIAGIWMTTLPGLLASQITSIERHLGISSSQIGFILSSNEIGYLSVVAIGSHIGKYSHIPRCLSVSGMIFSLTAIAMSFGRFEEPKVWQDGSQHSNNLSGGPDDGSTKFLCLSGVLPPLVNGSDVSDGHSPPPPTSHSSPPSMPWAFWLFVASAIVGGVVKSYRLPLLTYYIESNIEDKSKSGILLGSSFTVMVFSAPIAYLLGAFVSSLPVDLKETSMSKLDQRWVGAWWLGFMIVGVACLTFSAPIMCFPKHIRRREAEKDRKTSGSKVSRKQKVKRVFLEMPKSLARIFRRPVYVLSLVSGCIGGFAFTGWFAFTQKYIETQFNKTPQQVSLTTGSIVIFSLALGTFLGGFITTRLKLEMRGCVIMSVVTLSVTLVMDSLYLALGCDNSKVIGLQGSGRDSPPGCSCDETFLVCGDDHVNYRSPCWAGCTNVTNMIFDNCSEIGGGQVQPGLCALDCEFFIPYLTLWFLSLLVCCIGVVPGYLMVVRSVDHTDQSLATGASACLQTLLGVFPSPILYGKLIDSTCTLWSAVGGYCMLYDREQFRYRFNGLGIGLRTAHVVLLLLVLLLIRHRKSKDDVNTGRDHMISIKNHEI